MAVKKYTKNILIRAREEEARSWALRASESGRSLSTCIREVLNAWSGLSTSVGGSLEIGHDDGVGEVTSSSSSSFPVGTLSVDMLSGLPGSTSSTLSSSSSDGVAIEGGGSTGRGEASLLAMGVSSPSSSSESPSHGGSVSSPTVDPSLTLSSSLDLGSSSSSVEGDEFASLLAMDFGGE